MIERFLHTVITAGFEEVRDNPALLRDIFDQYDLPDAEVSAIQTLLANKFPLIKHQYARTDEDPPIIAIVLGSEGESEHYIGDFATRLDDGAEIVSAIWEHSYDILTYTEHPDHTLYLYQILKAIFVTAPLIDFGLFETHVSGMDLAPDTRYVPEHLFARKLTFKAQREFETIDRLIALTKAYKVRGLHIDKSGSPNDVGEVKTLVDLYQAGDDDDEA